MSETLNPHTGGGLAHNLIRMTGRNPREKHRGATPLELLFDLTFVIAFGQASNQLAHSIAEDHAATGIVAFAFGMFAIVWAWINFTWFASAYDTDDWFYRLTTMVQMIGVVVLALGLPAVFTSIEEGGVFDNGVMVAGYVIMRVAMVAQWLRAAKQDESRRRTALSYVWCISIAQVGWVIIAVLSLPLAAVLVAAPVLYLIEIGGPVLAERASKGTPWHPHHIAERYGLLAIIALGEGLFGTIAATTAIIERQEWDADATVVVIAGIGLTFGMWWNYFVLPSGVMLDQHRGRAWVWGYGHIVLYAAIAAVGAGLHVAAYLIEGEAVITTLGVVVSIAIPVALFTVTLFTIYSFLIGEVDRLHIVLAVVVLVILACAIASAASGVPLGGCLLIITVAPAIIVVGFETIGHRHEAEVLKREVTDFGEESEAMETL